MSEKLDLNLIDICLGNILKTIFSNSLDLIGS